MNDQLVDQIAQRSLNARSKKVHRDRKIRVVDRPEITLPFISVDDHLCEPPDTFAGRLPKRFAASTPTIVHDDDGADYWLFEDQRIPIGGSNVIAGWELEDYYDGPIALADARPGVYDIHERIKDMDLNGTIASLCFPSMVFGFAGQLFMRLSNRELGLAAMRAYNEWIDEKWAAPYPSRIIKCQVTWLLDPEVAAGEIYRNAAREFKAVTFPDDPAALGLPPISDECWDPFLGACEETETAINLHVGSSSRSLPGGLMIHGLVAARLWMESAHVPLRFPNIKLVMAEGGCGWVPMWIDQLNWHLRHAQLPSEFYHWPRDAMPPDEVIRRNFFFTTYYDPSILALREQIGIDNIMFESDYPHEDSSWPNTQSFLAEQIGSLPQDEIEKLAWKNAACLYRLSVTPHSLGWEPSEPSGV